MDKTKLRNHKPGAERPLPRLQKLPVSPLALCLSPQQKLLSCLYGHTYFLFKILFYQLYMQGHG